MHVNRRRIVVVVAVVTAGIVGVALAIGSMTKPDFWLTSDQRGQHLERTGDHARAAKAYGDPLRQGIALYRNGDFKEAAAAFARVGGAVGAFNQGDALLMHGAYDDAIAAYDRALAQRPTWNEAIENRALAVARKALIENVADDGTGGQEKADKVVVDNKAVGDRAHTVEVNAGKPLSDEEMRASWLRRVQTKPADFLAAKFAYQLQSQSAGGKP